MPHQPTNRKFNKIGQRNQNWNWTEQVKVEGDAFMVISAIQNRGTRHNGLFGHLFADTRQILQSSTQWKFSFGRREENKMAHRLARFSLTVDHPVSWFEEPPDIIFLSFIGG
ncbi:unnamed protein product [Malus baccata var. baccata]